MKAGTLSPIPTGIWSPTTHAGATHRLGERVNRVTSHPQSEGPVWRFGYAEDMGSAAGMRVAIRRVYDEDPGDGAYRVLVDRLWPRGITKARAAVDEWAKDAAPSPDLRRWYQHDPARFDEFARRYAEELAVPPASQVVARLRGAAMTTLVALVTATKAVEHSGAQVRFDVLTSSR